MNWEFVIGDVVVPIGLFLAGLFTGKTIEKRKNNKANIKGNNNTVIQDSKINR